MLSMFRTLIHPSSGACDFSIVSPHWLCVLVSMRVGVSVWLVWSGIRVAGWSSVRAADYSLQPGHYSSLPAPNLQPTGKQARNDQCGNQHHSRELLIMCIVVPETC